MFELKFFLIGAGETTDSHNAWMVFFFLMALNTGSSIFLYFSEIIIFWDIFLIIKRFSDFTKMFAEYICNFAIVRHNVILFYKY